MLTYIAVDIGGTQLRAARYPLEGIKPLLINKIPTKHRHSSLFERLVELIDSVWSNDEEVVGIGVAAPGPLNPHEGIIYSAPNIPEWKQLPLRNLLQQKYNVPVVIGNDANMAALGEWKYGAGLGHHHLIYLTISTGIGSGIITDDKLLLGIDGLAAELGHVTVIDNGPICSCGQRGHLEAISSGTAIALWVKKELEKGIPSILQSEDKITSIKISTAAQTGDKLSIRALSHAGKYLGKAVADFLHIFNPTAVIVGGGVSQCGDHLLEPMRTAISRYVFNRHYLEKVTITTAALGDDAGLIGVLYNVRDQIPANESLNSSI